MRPGRAATRIVAALAVAVVPVLGATPAHGAARPDCERARSATRIETGALRVFALPKNKDGVTRVLACRKGDRRPPVAIADEEQDEPYAVGDFVVLGLQLAWTFVACDGSGGSCNAGVATLDLRNRHRRFAVARPQDSTDFWDTERALPTPSGAVVFSAFRPPGREGRVAVLQPDGTVLELDRGAGVDPESLAVAVRKGKPTLVTWMSGTTIGSAEIPTRSAPGGTQT